MIKTLLIVVLMLALAAGAALTRPTEEQFKPFLREQLAGQNDGFFDKLTADLRTDGWMKDAAFKNRLLWTTVEKDGKLAYVGAFGHWWGKGVKS